MNDFFKITSEERTYGANASTGSLKRTGSGRVESYMSDEQEYLGYKIVRDDANQHLLRLKNSKNKFVGGTYTSINLALAGVDKRVAEGNKA